MDVDMGGGTVVWVIGRLVKVGSGRVSEGNPVRGG